jgi:hypothetical protein
MGVWTAIGMLVSKKKRNSFEKTGMKRNKNW